MTCLARDCASGASRVSRHAALLREIDGFAWMRCTLCDDGSSLNDVLIALMHMLLLLIL
jgi:hypothetical protein